MRTVFLGVLALGIALAGFAVYMAQNFIGQTQAQLEKEQAMRQRIGALVEVYVVNKPVNYGDTITPDDVQLVYWQKNALPEGAFTPEAPLFAEGEKAPRYVLRQMEQFEPILATKVTAPGETTGLTSMLKPGQRAFTIQFDDASGASRMLQPTNRVDIYWTGTAPNGQQKTMLIESSVEVIAVDRPPAKDQKATGLDNSLPKAMTVAASQEQVARLAQAQASGDLSVSLVAKDDQNTAGPASLEVDTTIFGAEEVVVEAPEQKRCFRKVRKGTEVLEEEIPCLAESDTN
ncbi:Flp pilus assembly protein CpaB [Gemmobacter aquaticus]|jgi:pilus assembly protein CpaB|uniref:Flp pilus assembly protein CpaB n=1 Tax=Gemmobacter aquaticus TaxID=490185 RepID=A0A917YIC7_9RHOB|nr:Flp pilus assembly protein CpaB [Gemmobacter aquaticus]GGO27987.1 Flp pilus assembly protein CpaB [Gemmobacter aquaticus]